MLHQGLGVLAPAKEGSRDEPQTETSIVAVEGRQRGRRGQSSQNANVVKQSPLDCRHAHDDLQRIQRETRELYQSREERKMSDLAKIYERMDQMAKQLEEYRAASKMADEFRQKFAEIDEMQRRQDEFEAFEKRAEEYMQNQSAKEAQMRAARG